MPRLFGHNLIFILLAAIVMYLIGWVWYGFLFESLMTEAEPTPAWRMFGLGMAIPLMFAVGLAMVANRTAGVGLMHYWRVAMICGAFFAIATSLFTFAYESDYSAALTLADIGHLLLVFSAGGIILSFGRGSEIA